ncbi:endonuclease/exonuclease/phosphatase family protein [Thalassotalea crassostreae]|uniref:endonuclease/exonuclease/phosphatase family protein n=1 Tax=Thalassotalea crassostreae TaxID=1763536 RepID=UPI0008383134|nr:endonuclease/exonuclease/phosphatase family protein [Thalassotalea crassostreae]
MENSKLKIATFNLFNYLEPPGAFYDFDRIYSIEQWTKKQKWVSDYLAQYQPDIIGFQEVFSPDSLKQLVATQGYAYFAVIDAPQVIDDFIYRSPVVAIASRYPIVEANAVQPDITLAQSIGLSEEFSFSRKVLRATVDVPHLGNCDCYVVHFKSKRSMIDVDDVTNKEVLENSAEKSIIEHLKGSIAGGWGSSIQRGSEAALLLVDMIQRREQTTNPMVLMGDFNNTLSDGILRHLQTDSLRFVSKFDSERYLQKYCLKDSWDLFEAAQINESTEPAELKAAKLNVRSPTHYYGETSSILDYILLSCEFDASYQDSLYQVSEYHTYDRHLINPIFERDGESTDHGIVLITMALRE